MQKSLRSKIENADLRFAQYADHHALRRPLDAIMRRAEQVDLIAEDMNRVVQSKLRMNDLQLATMAEKLELVSPLAVLQRGYSLTTDTADNVIRSAQSLAPGALIQTRLATGRVVSRVEEVLDP